MIESNQGVDKFLEATKCKNVYVGLSEEDAEPLCEPTNSDSTTKADELNSSETLKKYANEAADYDWTVKRTKKKRASSLFIERMRFDGKRKIYLTRLREEMKKIIDGLVTSTGEAPVLSNAKKQKIYERAFVIVSAEMGILTLVGELRLVRQRTKETGPYRKKKYRMEKSERAWEAAFKALPLRETMETLVDDFLWVMNHPAMLRVQKPNEIARPTMADMRNAPSRAAVQLLSQGMNARTKFMDTMHKLFAKHGGKEWQGDEDETEGGTDNGLDALESFYKGLD